MPEKIKDFTDLLVWQKSHQLALDIYKITRSFPAEERFGLISQMRRSAVSIPANIAEGFGKKGLRDKLNFYNIAQGSAEELKYYLILAKDLGYLADNDKFNRSLMEVVRMLSGLIHAIRRKNESA
jgi:four helix bundle protein